jgi:acetyltransferase-like isoleucine patch superfamily enzyme
MLRAPLLMFSRAVTGLASRGRNICYRLLGVRIRGYVWMRRIEIPRDHRNIELAGGCSLDRGVVLLCVGGSSDRVRLSIGAGTYLNRGVFVDAIESVAIGSHAAIGPNCYITDHDHGTADPSRPPLDQAMVSEPTTIGDNVWLGANVVVLKGVTIGPRTIVGAGSVVTRSLPGDCVAVGVPAKVIRARSPADDKMPEMVAVARP